MTTIATYQTGTQSSKKLISKSSENYTVFIVEDNYPNRMLLENYLSRLPNCSFDKKPNLDIFTFESGEFCLESDIRPDIVILDYYLDEANNKAMDGLTVMKEIKKLNPDAKIIIMSGQESVMITAELFNAGASDYVSKEHSCIVRIEQSLLRMITEIRAKKKQRNRNIALSILLFGLGVIAGLLF